VTEGLRGVLVMTTAVDGGRCSRAEQRMVREREWECGVKVGAHGSIYRANGEVEGHRWSVNLSLEIVTGRGSNDNVSG
jgi:hypothetical protein